MWGDENAASVPDQKALQNMDEGEKSQSLHSKTVWQRMAVSAAGPFANYVLAFVLFSGLFMTQGYRYMAPVIGGVLEGSPAAMAGLQVNDRIVSVDGTPVKRFEDIVAYVSKRPGQELTFQVQRQEAEIALIARPSSFSSKTLWGMSAPVGRLGVTQSIEMEVERKGPIEAMGLACKEMWHVSAQTVVGVFEMLTGQRSSDGMGGPLMIAQLSRQMAHSGLVALLFFMALLSVNLGLVNLFPIPMLDGGHLFLYGVEAVRGKPLSDAVLEWCYRIGLGIVMFLLLLTTWNDLKRLHIFQMILGWFA
jgi:regulator of sigma E protease